MFYKASGTYVPPAGQPVATGTVIQSVTFNALVTDIGNTFNNVLPCNGQAPISGVTSRDVSQNLHTESAFSRRSLSQLLRIIVMI
jgi:hypothetical protein